MKTMLERYQDFARNKKWSIPPQHIKVIEEIFGWHDHFTEKELAVHQRLAMVPKKTLSIVLERLVEAGLIRKIFFGENKIYYEHVYGHIHHDHLVCLQCGKIVEFRNEQIERQQFQVCQEHDFRMVKHSLHILGICPECRKTLPEAESFPREEVPLARDELLPLSTIPNGHRAKVVRIEGGMALQRRLRELGIISGIEIEVIANQFAGPFIIRVKGGRLAIGHNITHKVIVQDLSEG